MSQKRPYWVLCNRNNGPSPLSMFPLVFSFSASNLSRKKKIPIEKRFRRLKISDNIFKYKKNERKNFFLLISMG